MASNDFKFISMALAFLLSFGVMYPLTRIILILGYMQTPQIQMVYKWTLHLPYICVSSSHPHVFCLSRWHHNLLAAQARNTKTILFSSLLFSFFLSFFSYLLPVYRMLSGLWLKARWKKDTIQFNFFPLWTSWGQSFGYTHRFYHLSRLAIGKERVVITPVTWGPGIGRVWCVQETSMCECEFKAGMGRGEWTHMYT